MTGTCFCLLGESVPPSLGASLKYFRDEYVALITAGAAHSDGREPNGRAPVAAGLPPGAGSATA